MVQITDDGRLLKAVHGALPDNLEQTSLASDAAAVTAALPLCEDGVLLASDCAKIVVDWLKGMASSSAHTNKLACTWRYSHCNGDTERSGGICKVKAHRDLADVSDAQEDRNNHFGNKLADEYAAKGALLHGVPQAAAESYLRQAKELKKILLHMAMVLVQWPRVEILAG